MIVMMVNNGGCGDYGKEDHKEGAALTKMQVVVVVLLMVVTMVIVMLLKCF